MSSKKNKNDNNKIDNEKEFSEEEEEEENIINTKSKNKTKNFEEEEFENEEEENKNEEEESSLKEAPIDKMNLDMSEIKLRIQYILDILSSFKTKREPGKSRHDYIMELKQYLKQYYDYNDDICDLITNLFSPNEAVEFMESNNQNKILTIRTNSLKTKRRELAKLLIQRGVNLDPLAEWSKVGLKIYSSQVPIGATPEYLSGQYMLQSSSSFLPVIALDPQPNEKILDMCASPGGKTTYIAQLMKNQGILVANDMKKTRLKSLFFNVHRMGIKNVIITNYDGRMFSKLYNKFDRVLLDAPCSGLGVISKDQSVKVNRSYKEILENSRVQKELILSAIDCCNYKTGGIIVYSTCTISVEENEWVVDYALRNRYVKCVEMGLEIGEKGLTKFREKHFHNSLGNSRRIYPHVHNMDGFFVAKLKKYADGPKIKQGEKDTNKFDLDYEPQDVQISLKKNMFDNDEDDADDDDGIFNGDDDEKDESDVENDAIKYNNKSRINVKSNKKIKNEKKNEKIIKKDFNNENNNKNKEKSENKKEKKKEKKNKKFEEEKNIEKEEKIKNEKSKKEKIKEIKKDEKIKKDNKNKKEKNENKNKKDDNSKKEENKNKKQKNNKEKKEEENLNKKNKNKKEIEIEEKEDKKEKNKIKNKQTKKENEQNKKDDKMLNKKRKNSK